MDLCCCKCWDICTSNSATPRRLIEAENIPPVKRPPPDLGPSGTIDLVSKRKNVFQQGRPQSVAAAASLYSSQSDDQRIAGQRLRVDLLSQRRPPLHKSPDTVTMDLTSFRDGGSRSSTAR
eukprot:TRINITY_DN36149_c0_g1_i1.p1 TRINITY_DN36149_c0_g1~~TRINITY_DN36149_c0_g1_i1.p1  ORF type:complete len:121 (-),score=18.26 TRINITY_DN36149_c0_g1_i1:70-432(-)